VSHEEALGGPGDRENAAEYTASVSAGGSWRAPARCSGPARGTRENYIMVDDDFQLPVVAARYLADRACGGTASATFWPRKGTWPVSSPTWRSSRGRRPRTRANPVADQTW